MKLNFKYETYQDVRSNLSGYTALILIPLGFVWFNFILPPDHQNSILDLFNKISLEHGYLKLIKGVSLVAVMGVLAYFLIEIIKIHDHIYDRYITKWRYYYAIDFIIPHLVYPFASRLSRRFFIDSKLHVVAYQDALFYHFVGDRDTLIKKNTVLRFYEKITIYWITQVNEIFLALTIFLSISYSLFYYSFSVDYSFQLSFVLFCTVIFYVVNKIFNAQAMKGVRKLTQEEIFEIHDSHLDILQARLIKLCSDLNLGYNEN